MYSNCCYENALAKSPCIQLYTLQTRHSTSLSLVPHLDGWNGGAIRPDPIICCDHVKQKIRIKFGSFWKACGAYDSRETSEHGMTHSQTRFAAPVEPLGSPYYKIKEEYAAREMDGCRVFPTQILTRL